MARYSEHDMATSAHNQGVLTHPWMYPCVSCLSAPKNGGGCSHSTVSDPLPFSVGHGEVTVAPPRPLRAWRRHVSRRQMWRHGGGRGGRHRGGGCDSGAHGDAVVVVAAHVEVVDVVAACLVRRRVEALPACAQSGRGRRLSGAGWGTY